MDILIIFFCTIRRHRLGTNFAASLWSSIAYVLNMLNLPEQIVRELRAERLKCLLYLRGIELSYPQVLGVVQTRNAAAILLTMRDHSIHELYSSGEIDSQEYDLLQQDNNDRRKLVHEAPLFFQLPKTIQVRNKFSVFYETEIFVSQVLKANPVFNYLIEQGKFKSLVLDRGQRQVYEKGQLVLKYGEPSDGLYILIRGRVHMESSKHASSLPVSRLSLLEADSLSNMFGSPGSMFGLENCIFGLPMKFSVIVDSEVAHIFFLPSSHVSSILKLHSTAALQFYRMAVVEWIKQTVPDADPIMSLVEEGNYESSRHSVAASLSFSDGETQVVLGDEMNIDGSSMPSNSCSIRDVKHDTIEYSQSLSASAEDTVVEVGAPMPSDSESNRFHVDDNFGHTEENICCIPANNKTEDIARFVLSKIASSRLCYLKVGEYSISGECGLIGVLVEGSLQLSPPLVTIHNNHCKPFVAPCLISLETDRKIVILESAIFLQIL